MIGAGGAARAIVEAAGRAGAERIVVVNRTISSAERAASMAGVAVVGDVSDLAEVDVVVNATSIGMAGGPEPDGIPLSGAWIDQHHTVDLSVRDTGSGIPEPELARLFRPFVQIGSNFQKERGGWGLGLSVCRNIAAQIGQQGR